MRIQENSNKGFISAIICLTLTAGLFFCMQRYEKKQFHKDVNPKAFSQVQKPATNRQIASVQESSLSTN